MPCCYRHLCPATAAAAAAAAATVAVALTIAVPITIAIAVAVTVAVAVAIAFAVAVAVVLPTPLLMPSLLPKEFAIHAAMERLLNGSRIGVNVAARPKGATDMNAIEQH